MSQVLKPMLKDIAYMKHSKLPLSEQEEGVLKVIGQGLEWTDLVWGEQSLEVKGAEVIGPLKNYKYFPL